MKRLLATVILMLCLAFPALAGHTQTSGVYCDCNEPTHGFWGMTLDAGEDIQQDQTSNTDVSELDLLIDALLVLIRF